MFAELASGALSGAATGATIGGPIGAGVGALAGGALGYMSANSTADAQAAARQAAAIQARGLRKGIGAEKKGTKKAVGYLKPYAVSSHFIPPDYDIEAMCSRLAEDAGLPIYQQLVAGPQSRKKRTKRPLRNGKEAGIYEVTLLAIAETGPKTVISYEELRTVMSGLSSEMMPQKHEITSALKHLASIAMKAGSESAIDWDDSKREINVADPYLRFYLRWRIRSRA